MTNQQKKRKIWKEAKVKWLQNVPKKYKVTVRGLDDDGEYYHPEIQLTDDLMIDAQGDIEKNYIYAEGIKLKAGLTYNHSVHTIFLSINYRDEFEYIVNNMDTIQPKIMDSIKMIEQLCIMQSDLDTIQRDIIHNSVTKYKDNDRLERSAKMLYNITEFLENERITI